MSTDVVSELPAVGYMVYMGDIPVAAGFLRTCEGGHAFIDSLISNPEVNADLRHSALNKVFDNLIKTAKDKGVKKLYGITLDNNTIERASSFGCKKLPHLLMGLDLTA